MNRETLLKSILQQHLQLGNEISVLAHETPLLGAIPELDSMGVVNIITAIEECFGFCIDDDEISAELFETLGSLLQFIESKL